MKARSAIARLATIRASRGLPPGGAPLSAMVKSVSAELVAAAKGSARVDAAWAAVAPAALASLVVASSEGRGGGGVLKLTPRSPAARFALDRWLRGGGEALLRGVEPRITAVRIVR